MEILQRLRHQRHQTESSDYGFLSKYLAVGIKFWHLNVIQITIPSIHTLESISKKIISIDWITSINESEE